VNAMAEEALAMRKQSRNRSSSRPRTRSNSRDKRSKAINAYLSKNDW
jgi:hypothetical protein